MSTAPQVSPAPIPVPSGPKRPLGRTKRSPARMAIGLAVLAALALAAVWGSWRLIENFANPLTQAIPTARVQRGTVRLDVFAQGVLRGGNPEVLSAPSIRGTLTIKSLLADGSPVQPGETVVSFDTAQQEYNLTLAQQSLEQAQQQVAQAQASAAATTEDDHYQLEKAQFDVERAALQVRKNPTLATVDAKKNDLNLAAAQAHLAQLQKDIASRAASNQAAVAVQVAVERKAQQDASAAQHDIAAMTLVAKSSGYVSVQANRSGGIIFVGMALPTFKVGDTARPGQAIVQIPTIGTWQVDLQVSELDAGHLSAGEPAAVHFVAFPGRTFPAKVTAVGAVSGPPWQRQVLVTVQLDQGDPGLKPGLSANGVITTSVMRNVLWAPGQAVFDQGGNPVVYIKRGGGFQQQPVTVVQRSESQVVLQGLPEGAVIALANPQAQAQAPAARKPAGASPLAGAGGGRRGRGR